MELKLQYNERIRGTSLLLIVPYGIETQKLIETVFGSALLIVPYGIETKILQNTCTPSVPFNRTLWN